nr:DNA-directed RNA polymerase subunit delta [Paenibacillus turpanensis]
MVDLAFMILKLKNEPMYYRDLMQEVAKIKGFAEEEMLRVIAQLYTEINIDGRFACVGNNLWGLIRWYPVEKADEKGGARPRIINDVDDDLDDEDLYQEEEEEDYLAEGEDYDTIDEDRDEIFEEEEEAEEDIGEIDEDADDDEDSDDELEGDSDDDEDEEDEGDFDDDEDDK